MNTIFSLSTRIFDGIRQFWEAEATHRRVSWLLVVIFLFSLAAIELNRLGLIPDPLSRKLPVIHYMAINLAFVLVLILEILSMIFSLPGSLSISLGKQFEILALIFLRNAFKKLSDLPEPASLVHNHDVLWQIMAYGFGAVAIFALLGLYLVLCRKLDPALAPGPALTRFIEAKKTVAFATLIIFCGMGLYNGLLILSGHHGYHFFQCFYTVLIFSDILLILIAQTFLPEFSAIFRNSGYALATLLIRLSLTAPLYFDILIGILSVVLAVLLTLIYNRFFGFNRMHAQ